jgi:hypothetical protein
MLPGTCTVLELGNATFAAVISSAATAVDTYWTVGEGGE